MGHPSSVHDQNGGSGRAYSDRGDNDNENDDHDNDDTIFMRFRPDLYVCIYI